MKIKEKLYVKTYCLSDGEIAIGRVEHTLAEDKEIVCWSGVNRLWYKDEEEPRIIKPNTLIWNKKENRYVFAYCGKMRKGYACFSTIVVNASEYLETLLIDDEKVKYYWD